jgi:IS1 family transposase
MQERTAAVEKENSDLKETVRRLESKMATIMEFMLMLK